MGRAAVRAGLTLAGCFLVGLAPSWSQVPRRAGVPAVESLLPELLELGAAGGALKADGGGRLPRDAVEDENFLWDPSQLP
ncbi:unnamed protein product [Effrenium voratum]|uniref:Uncharacterized protein n=1 Tax=Effrenium voratum TaxID=2562239 RepID=A0AA36JLK6_9DINO|nr:unnamed protein product [Effrenium voratum]